MVGGSRWLDPLALLRHLFPALPLTPLAIEVIVCLAPLELGFWKPLDTQEALPQGCMCPTHCSHSR